MTRFLIGSSSMDLRLHSHEFISKFIEAFRKNPCLWHVQNPEYKNRKSRLKAYNKLLKFVQNIEPKVTLTDVIRKLQSIRASHRKERRKVKESLRNPKSSANVYIPKLWYYKELEFLNQANNKGASKTIASNTDNMSEKSNNATDMSMTDKASECSIVINDLQIKQYISEDEGDDSVKSIISNLSLDSENLAHETWESFPASTSKNFSMQTKNQSYNSNALNNGDTNEILNYIARKIGSNRDEYDIFGKNVAAELRTMDHQQRIIAKKLMNDVIFHGQLGHLSLETQVTINSFYSET